MSYTVIGGKLVKTTRTKFKPRSISTGAFLREQAQQPGVTKPDPALKGKKDGNCNVTACQQPGATWWNVGSKAYYCEGCATMINIDACERFKQPHLCYPSREEGEAEQRRRQEAYEAAKLHVMS
jgi:hypothetical protein